MTARYPIIRKTIRGLPKATKTVGRYIAIAPIKTIKKVGKKIIQGLNKPNPQDQKVKEAREKFRYKVIMEAIEAGDYMPVEGDAEILKKYKVNRY